mmetsp:Transcript_29348/g.45344  ORF Transcript_29348/g.45344 Transcript_29348/m.45344 type:complete len:224 (-) Transcript_29348:26-697(-)
MTLMLTLCTFLCADRENGRIPHGTVETALLRDALLRLFFIGLSADEMHRIMQLSFHPSKYCDRFEGIKCKNGEIIDVCYHDINGGNFNIDALPHSVQRLSIASSKQTFTIKTRSMPQDLRSINLTLNKIVGRIDLTTLPEKLDIAQFHWNRLEGRISLDKLPRTLRELNLRANPKLVQKTVYYDDLPETIEHIYLVYNWEQKRIKSVRPVDPSQKVKDTRIFE